jgi:hypothetical protein
MTAYENPTAKEAESNSFLNRLNRLSRRNKIIGIALLVFLVLLVVSIPGDHSQLLARQERVEAAQVAYDLAFPAVGPVIEHVNGFLLDAGVDLSANRSYTALSSTLNSINRANAATASQFQAVVTFHRNVHSLLDDVPELESTGFATVVSEMDTTLGVAWLALMEMNTAIDEYNGYHSWISASVAGALFDLPQGYDDPIPSRSNLNRSTSLEPEL